MSQLAAVISKHRTEILTAWQRAARLLSGTAQLGRPVLADEVTSMLETLSIAGRGRLQLPPQYDRSFDLAQVIREIEVLRGCIKKIWQDDDDGSVSLREMRLFDQLFDTTISDAIQRYTCARDLPRRKELTIASADAGRLVSDVLASHEEDARQRGIRLRSIDELLGVELMCDRERIAQVFGSILGKAIRSCVSGDEILVRAVAGETDARFAISDPGPGISPNDLPRVFEPDSGVELYVSKGIIDAHAGALWVESSVGDGTTFFFTLPLAR